MAGPIARQYKAGSIVYFENDSNVNEIYVLHSGRVVLIYTDIVSGEEKREDLAKGEFFGVKSALGKYKREESAQVIGDSVILVFKINEFEILSMKNIPLTMKMLRVFSNQLRNMGRHVREVLGEPEVMMPATELLNVADYYYKSSQMDYAIYGYEKYIENYPVGKYIDRARDMLVRCRKGERFPESAEPLVHEVESEAGTVNQLNEISAEGVAQDSSESLMNILYEGITLVGNQKYDEAIAKFNRILEKKKLGSAEDAKAYEKAQFELGRAQFSKKDLNASLDVLQVFIKKFPKSEFVKPALLHIALIFDQKNQMEKAVSFYNKVASIPPNDGDSAKAKERLKKLTGQQ